MNNNVILLELNEVNFDYVRRYGADGKLPALNKLIADHGVIETVSETSYSELEPWIQWVTAHTGKSFCEHGIFRLGDVAQREVFQIWEAIESSGRKVGAICPMNATNRCSNPAFFVPDPWTKGKVVGPTVVRNLYAAIAQAVNDNAQGRITFKSAFWLSFGLARYAKLRNYRHYGRLIANALRGRSWTKAMLLDQLLADVYISLLEAKKPDFSSLFLNSAAHIQHHYLFNSRVYEGTIRNPDWYISAKDDPIFEVYDHYDRIIAELQRQFPFSRLIIATGLHQDTHCQLTYYWRLRDHAEFLRKHRIAFAGLEPRMSRDFLVKFANVADAALAEAKLKSMIAHNGENLFEIDNRGNELFVMLVWNRDIEEDFVFFIDGIPHDRFRENVSFVAIKNGQHNGIGYLIDTERQAADTETIQLHDLPSLICDAFNLDWKMLQVGH